MLPYVSIGRNVRLTKAVVDRGVRIPDGLVVGEDPELDAKRFRRTENGVTLITQPMIDKLALMSELKVLSVASEIFPLVKTGGLADVAGALPAALAREGVEIAHAGPRLSGGDGQARRRRGRRTNTPTCSAARRASSRARRPGSICSCSTRRISSTGRAIPISAPTGSTGPTMRSASPRWRASAPTSASARSPAFRPARRPRP